MFVIGAGSTYAVGATGGATTHTHSDHAALAHDSGSLAISTHTGTNVSAHAGATVGDHSAHTHELPFIGGAASFRYRSDMTTGSSLTPDVGVAVGASSAAAGRAVSDSGGPTTHTVGQASAHVITQPSPHTVSGSHAAQSHSTSSSMGPYYALAYIMKL